MVATTTITTKGLSIKVADSDFTLVSVLSDIDMRQGTPVDETAWLDGGAAADSYPGALDGFAAKNTNTTNANGGLRMVTISANVVLAGASDALLFSAGASKILGIVGSTSTTAAKDVVAVMTNTGLIGASATVAPLSTGGVLPCLMIGSEGANNVCQFTVLLLN